MQNHTLMAWFGTSMSTVSGVRVVGSNAPTCHVVMAREMNDANLGEVLDDGGAVVRDAAGCNDGVLHQLEADLAAQMVRDDCFG